MLFLLSMGWQKFCLQLALEKNIFKMKDLHLHVNIICKFWKTDTKKHYLSLCVLSGTVSIFVLSAKEEKHFPDLKWSSVMRDITYNEFKKLNSIKWVSQTLHEKWWSIILIEITCIAYELQIQRDFKMNGTLVFLIQ